MTKIGKATLASLCAGLILLSATPSNAEPTASAAYVTDQAFFEAKRETCWRTNRQTGQKFRIC